MYNDIKSYLRLHLFNNRRTITRFSQLLFVFFRRVFSQYFFCFDLEYKRMQLTGFILSYMCRSSEKSFCTTCILRRSCPSLKSPPLPALPTPPAGASSPSLGDGGALFCPQFRSGLTTPPFRLYSPR